MQETKYVVDVENGLNTTLKYLSHSQKTSLTTFYTKLLHIDTFLCVSFWSETVPSSLE